MPFSVHSTLEKHMRKCVVTNNYSTGKEKGDGAAYKKCKKSLKFTLKHLFTVLAASLKNQSAPIAEANSLLALSKAPVSSLSSPAVKTTSNTPLPNNIAQSNQMVLNWLQVLNKSS